MILHACILALAVSFQEPGEPTPPTVPPGAPVPLTQDDIEWVDRPDRAVRIGTTAPGGFLRRVSQRDLEHIIALYAGEVAWRGPGSRRGRSRGSPRL